MKSTVLKHVSLVAHHTRDAVSTEQPQPPLLFTMNRTDSRFFLVNVISSFFATCGFGYTRTKDRNCFW